MQREWEEAHAVTEETVEGPPSRRANATLTACPNGNHLWFIGGEYFSDDGKAVRFIYENPDTDSWPGLSIFTMMYTGIHQIRCVSRVNGLWEVVYDIY